MTIRQPCPPAVCDCEREQLLEAPGADQRILQLTRQEEKSCSNAWKTCKAWPTWNACNT